MICMNWQLEPVSKKNYESLFSVFMSVNYVIVAWNNVVKFALEIFPCSRVFVS